MVSAQLKRDLAMYGGISQVSHITRVDVPPPPPPELLKLYCTANPFGKGKCDKSWESETFTPCPVHGRAWVHKGERPATPEVAASN